MAQRFKELTPRSEVTNSGDLDPEFVIQNLLQVLQRAVESGKFSSANRTLELLGKFQGMFNERRNDRREWEADLPDFDSMTPEKIFQYMRTKMSDLNPAWQLINRRAPIALDGKCTTELSALTIPFREGKAGVKVGRPGARAPSQPKYVVNCRKLGTPGGARSETARAEFPPAPSCETASPIRCGPIATSQ